MRVLVLGATGGAGRQIVREATSQGHSVVALVRSKSKGGDLVAAEIVEGDARDEDALYRALEGCDAAISSLGTPMSPFREVTLLSVATRALVKALDRRSFRRRARRSGRQPPAPSAARRRSRSYRAEHQRRGPSPRAREGSSSRRSSVVPRLRWCLATRSYRRIAGDHRKPLARYGAIESALRERLAPAALHHSWGHDPAYDPLDAEWSRRD